MLELDVTAERCLFTDSRNRHYMLTPKQGHFYEGEPFKIQIKEKPHLTYNGVSQYYDWRTVITFFERESTDIGQLSLTKLRFNCTIAQGFVQMFYEWEATVGINEQVMPVNR